MYPRYSKNNIEAALSDTPVTFIMGARQCGKTTLAKSLINKNWQYINLDDQAQLNIAKADPIGFIRNLSAAHIAIDEIQRLPELLLAIKQSVDENRMPGRFLLTGSSNALLLPQVSDSLAGRIESIHLNTLSECEIRKVTPSFLQNILNQVPPQTKETRIKKNLINRVITGCYPEPLQRESHKRVTMWYKQYINSLIQKDIKEIEQINHPEKMLKLLKLTAHYSAKLINLTDLSNKLDLNKETIKKYISLLEHLFLIKLLPAWHSNKSKRLIKTPKLHLNDTGIVCALQDINTDYLQNTPDTFGSLLETFVINELQKQAAWLDQDTMFYHYRDKDKVEVDCIIENSAGECFGIEVKSSATLTNKDFTGLNRLKNTIPNKFKMGVLLYDGDHTTAFSDNLYAVPIGALWN